MPKTDDAGEWMIVLSADLALTSRLSSRQQAELNTSEILRDVELVCREKGGRPLLSDDDIVSFGFDAPRATLDAASTALQIFRLRAIHGGPGRSSLSGSRGVKPRVCIYYGAHPDKADAKYPGATGASTRLASGILEATPPGTITATPRFMGDISNQDLKDCKCRVRDRSVPPHFDFAISIIELIAEESSLQQDDSRPEPARLASAPTPDESAAVSDQHSRRARAVEVIRDALSTLLWNRYFPDGSARVSIWAANAESASTRTLQFLVGVGRFRPPDRQLIVGLTEGPLGRAFTEGQPVFFLWSEYSSSGKPGAYAPFGVEGAAISAVAIQPVWDALADRPRPIGCLAIDTFSETASGVLQTPAFAADMAAVCDLLGLLLSTSGA